MEIIKISTGPLIAASTTIGIGMGGFVDGILLHQILQWHQMISNIMPPDTLFAKNINMFWDGIFHTATWTITFAGIIMLFNLNHQNVVKSSLIFTGGLIMGWGIFNVIDSLFNHYIFQLHNVRESVANPSIYNHGFLIFAIIQILLGLFLIKKGKARITAR